MRIMRQASGDECLMETIRVANAGAGIETSMAAETLQSKIDGAENSINTLTLQDAKIQCDRCETTFTVRQQVSGAVARLALDKAGENESACAAVDAQPKRPGLLPPIDLVRIAKNAKRTEESRRWRENVPEHSHLEVKVAMVVEP